MRFPNIEEIATREIVAVDRSASISEALSLMLRHDIHDVLVTGDGTVGIFTVHDVVKNRDGDSLLTRSLQDTGVRPLPCYPEGTNILDILAEIEPEDDHICVLGPDGEPVGIASFADLVSSVDPQMMSAKQTLGQLVTKNLVRPLDAGVPTRHRPWRQSTHTVTRRSGSWRANPRVF